MSDPSDAADQPYDISTLADNTPVYVQDTEDESITMLGTFSDEEAVYEALRDQYDDYVGRLSLFTSLGSYALPRPFEGYSDAEVDTIEALVGALDASDYTAGASTASPGGTSRCSRFGFTFDLSARDYDFTFYRTPDEKTIDVDGDHPDTRATRFEAICGDVQSTAGLAADVAFVAADRYVPGRGARHHNVRFYGRLVPADPPAALDAELAFRADDRVLDALPNYDLHSPRVSWVNPDGSLRFDDEASHDLLVAVDDVREDVTRQDVDDYDMLMSSSIPFAYDDLVETGTTLVNAVSDTAAAKLDLAAVGTVYKGAPVKGVVPILGVTVSDTDGSAADADTPARADWM